MRNDEQKHRNTFTGRIMVDNNYLCLQYIELLYRIMRRMCGILNYVENTTRFILSKETSSLTCVFSTNNMIKSGLVCL